MNLDHWKILKEALEKKDIGIWNRWRKKNRAIQPNLSEANLIGANLSEVNLIGANLSGAYMCNANINRAKLSETELSSANLKDANLYEANLYRAELSNAILKNANLNGADLEETNLCGVDLSGTDLSRANLSGAELGGANLYNAKLDKANLHKAKLHEANLIRANLINAQLSGAKLNDAKLNDANLKEANIIASDLSGADLNGADLSGAKLISATLYSSNLTRTILEYSNFIGSKLNETIFGLTNLSSCKGLEEVEVKGKCIIDFETLQRSKNLPRIFLRKIGLPELYIDYLPEFVEKPINLYPVFLSHSWANKTFARKLYEALIQRGVLVWFDEKQMMPGDKIIGGISKGINVYDKLVLVCSKESLKSWWVKEELERIMKKERHYQNSGGKEGLLIPITIDNHIYESDSEYTDTILKHMVGDFKDWQYGGKFEQSLDKLIRALNVNRSDKDPISLL